MKTSRGAGSVRAGRYGWSVALSLVFGVFVASTGCFAEESVTSDNPPEGCKPGANQGDTCSSDCIDSCGSSIGTKLCRCEGGVFTQCPCMAPPYEKFPVALEQPYCDRASGATTALIATDCPGREGTSCVGDEKDLNSGVTMVCTCAARPNAEGQLWSTWDCVEKVDEVGLPTCESIGTGLAVPMDERPCPAEWSACIGRDYDSATETPKGCFCLKEPNGLLQWTCGSSNKWIIPIQPKR